MTDYRNGVRAAAGILLGLVVLCARTAPIIKIEPDELRPNVPPRMM